MTNENTSSEIDYEYEDFNSSKRRKMTSNVWEEMQCIQTTDGSKVLCKHCGKQLQDNCGTSHLKQHLIICPTRPKPVGVITQDSTSSTCLIESGLNKVLMDRPLKTEPESQDTCSSQIPNYRNSTHIASIENASSPIRELNQKTSSTMLLPSVESQQNQEEPTLDDVEMKAFYASLDVEIPVMLPFQDTTVTTELPNARPCEKTKKALKTLQDLFSKDFSVLLCTGQFGMVKSTIEYLSKMSADDGISEEMRLLILDVSREFTRRNCDYNDASRKIESASSNIFKADKLEQGLEANKNQFKEVLSLENELSNQLGTLEQRKKELEEQMNAVKANISVFHSAENQFKEVLSLENELSKQLTTLEQRKKELEEQINAIKANISVLQSAKITTTKRKREVFEEAKTLKAQRDELRKQLPHLKDELELAKKIQENIRAEWSKLGENFKEEYIEFIRNHEDLCCHPSWCKSCWGPEFRGTKTQLRHRGFSTRCRELLVYICQQWMGVHVCMSSMDTI